jgi:membrane-bound lytic murein transglycosylase A
LRLIAVAGAALLAAACTTVRTPAPVPPVTPPVVTPAPVLPPPVVQPPKPRTAIEAGVALAAPRTFTQAHAERALNAFRRSCPVLVRRRDASGLTAGADWQALCSEAAIVQPATAGAFFRDRFEWVRVGAEPAFATGYYEPEIIGSRTPQPGYTPIYRTPPDLIRCTRADGQTGRGRYDATGQCVLYPTRAEIEDGALAGKGLELAWAADPVELFFLEIQGSGRLRLPDGSVMRLGYDNQNGREYVAIGRILRERNILPPGGANMGAIRAWMKSQPDGGRALMRENSSYIFFRELTGPGPLGAINVPVTAQATVAADPLFVPLGAPVWLDVDRPEADGLWVAQDTGGAIKGANRFDTFWGAGDYATVVAGGMAAKGEALLLLPRGSVSRALAARATAAASGATSQR